MFCVGVLLRKGGQMTDYIAQNKAAWEYNAYEFWLKEAGTPQERAAEILRNPIGALKRYAAYFDSYEGTRVANICGSCGKKAVPLAVLGADVTIFDISEENRRYALELALAAGVRIDYEVGNVLEIDRGRFAGIFDVVFMEGGVLHYFHDIDAFMRLMHALLRPGGIMICSDFHPFTKIADLLETGMPVTGYFSTDVFEGEMAHARFFEKDIREKMPKCSYRKYTLSEIVNSVIRNGFTLKRFDEYPSWANGKVPGEFTVVAQVDDILFPQADISAHQD